MTPNIKGSDRNHEIYHATDRKDDKQNTNKIK